MKPLNLKSHEATGLLNGTVSLIVREVKPQPKPGDNLIWNDTVDSPNFTFGNIKVGDGQDWYDIKSPLGKAGDQFWCREVWGIGARPDPFTGWKDILEYECDEFWCVIPETADYEKYDTPGWKTPSQMPRWASRISIQNVDVQLKRLGEMSLGDMVALGWIKSIYEYQPAQLALNYQPTFYDSQNSKGAWERDKDKFFAFARVKRV